MPQSTEIHGTLRCLDTNDTAMAQLATMSDSWTTVGPVRDVFDNTSLRGGSSFYGAMLSARMAADEVNTALREGNSVHALCVASTEEAHTFLTV